jgi:hypothetical protein
MVDFQLYKHGGGFDRKKRIESIDISGSQYRKKNAMFFFSKEDTPDANNMYNYPNCEVLKIHETMSDKQITRHYNNPFAKVRVNIYERTIKRKGNKIIITNCEYIKERQINSKYFASITSRVTFTFDFGTGNFQIILTNTKGKKKGVSKTFRTNNFFLLKNTLRETPGIFRLTRYKDDTKFKFKKELSNCINDKEFVNLISKLFDVEIHTLNKMDSYIGFYNKIIEKFIELRKIKVPDHSYEHLLLYAYPKEKLLKKNDRKLIAAVLEMYGIKSKFTIKLLHKYPYLNLNVITKLCLLLGNEYQKHLASINDNIFAISQTQIRDQRPSNYINDFKMQIANFKINEIEKENIIKLVNDEKFNKPLTEDVLGDLYDHFNMIDKVKEYDPSIFMKARTYAEFRTEHMELSKMISAIKKGWVIEYVYDEKTILQIEEPITKFRSYDIGGGLKGTDMNCKTTLYPYILKREEEYIEEGKVMHHCVASYADHEKSMIVSIRNESELDRVTCEFDIQTGNMVQARYFCNATPPEIFKETIETVNDKIRLLARYGTLNWKEKKKVPVKINGIEVIATEPRRASDLFGF